MCDGMLCLVVISFVTALLVAWAFHPLCRRVALKSGVVDRPNHRRLNDKPIPVMGGVGVFFGVVAAMAIMWWHLGGMIVEYIALLCGFMILILGVIDDKYNLSPFVKIMAEMMLLSVAVLYGGFYVDELHGLWGIDKLPVWLAVSTTIVVGVGIINAINLIDGVDGLCSGYISVLSLIYGLLFLYLGDVSYALLAFALLGALIPFICYNQSRGVNKMFLGDGGSLSLGVLIFAFIVRGMESSSELLSGYGVSFSLAILALPLFDALRVVLMRVLRGVSPLHGDKSHLHHVFIERGWSHAATSIALVVMQLLVVAVWLLCYHLESAYHTTLYVVAIASGVIMWGTYFVLHCSLKCSKN